MKKYYPLLLSAVLAMSNVAASAETICEFNEEEIISRGITYQSREIFDGASWTKADIIKADLNDENVSVRVLTAPGGSSSLATVKEMASQSGAKAAVNGDFFNFVPKGATETNMLGMVYQSGELVSTPAKDGLVSFALTEDNRVVFDYFTFSGKIFADHTSLCDYRVEFDIYQINKTPVTTGHITMITSAWGDFVTVPAECYAMICEKSENGYTVTGTSPGGEKVSIPDGGAVFIANSSINGFLSDNFAVGDNVTTDISVSPDIGAIKEATGGNTVIVKDGQVAKFTNNIAGNNQRTAIGVSKSGDTLYLVTVDGRQSDCPGMTQTKLAEFMISLGCDSAVNLDGGGSTTMVTENKVDNSLNVKNDVSSLRKVSTSVGVFADHGPAGEVFGGEIVLSDNCIILGDSVDAYALFYDENYTPVRDAEVTFTCSDPLAVISGSRIMPTAPGTFTVGAQCGDKLVETNLTVIDDIFAINVYPEVIDSSSDQPLTVTAYDRNGQSAVIPTSLISFSATGSVNVENGVVKKGGSGTVTASYNNLTSTAAVNSPSYARPLDSTAQDKFEGEIENAYSFTVIGSLSPKKLIGLYSVNRTLASLSGTGDIYALSTVESPNAEVPKHFSALNTYTERVVDGTRIITLPNNNSHSISKTDSSSWSKFKNAVDFMAEKNMVIMMPEPYYYMSDGEQKVFDHFLSDLTDRDINVFVLAPGAKSEVTVDNGVRYIYLGSAGDETIASYGYDKAVSGFYKFTISGDEIKYKKTDR